MEKPAKKAKKKKTRSKKKSKKISNEVPFKNFFAQCVRDGKLRYWQEAEIWAFFRDNRLRAKEDINLYRKMLEKY